MVHWQYVILKNLLLQILLLWVFSFIFTIAFENLLAYLTQMSKYTIIILNSLLIISILCLTNHKYKLTKIFIKPAHDTRLDKIIYIIPIILYTLRAVSIFLRAYHVVYNCKSYTTLSNNFAGYCYEYFFWRISRSWSYF